MDELQKLLRRLKYVEWGQGLVSLWVVNRSMSQRQANYEILKVEAEDKLRSKLRGFLTRKIDQSNLVEEYQPVTDDQDERVFGIKTLETDFSAIQKHIEETVTKGSAGNLVTTPEQLMGSWGYIIRVQKVDKVLYGFRQVSRLWTTKKVRNLMSLLFEKEMLVDLDDKQVFHLDSLIDFMVFEDTLLILDKKHFESAMNFRAGMEQHRDDVLVEFAKLKLFPDIEPMRATIGDNVRLLRKIAMVRNSGYYRDQAFVEKLHALNKKKGWGLVIENGQIVVTPENVELVLTLLNNDRLTSEINEETFDVAVKKPVS
jgi:hypothetical protein